MLREDVLEALEKIETRTKDFKEITVNLCFAYDSIHEIESSIEKMADQSYRSFMYSLGPIQRGSSDPPSLGCPSPDCQ